MNKCIWQISRDSTQKEEKKNKGEKHIRQHETLGQCSAYARN